MLKLKIETNKYAVLCGETLQNLEYLTTRYEKIPKVNG
jgi:hypothetical protein